MQTDNRDAAYLWDMLYAARAVKGFVSSRKYNDYEKDRMLRSAVESNIEIIGEAANRISDAFQKAHPEIPWNWRHWFPRTHPQILKPDKKGGRNI